MYISLNKHVRVGKCCTIDRNIPSQMKGSSREIYLQS